MNTSNGGCKLPNNRELEEQHETNFPKIDIYAAVCGDGTVFDGDPDHGGRYTSTADRGEKLCYIIIFKI